MAEITAPGWTFLTNHAHLCGSRVIATSRLPSDGGWRMSIDGRRWRELALERHLGVRVAGRSPPR